MNIVAKSPEAHLTVVREASDYSKMDDAQIVILCQQKDQAAFEVLIKRHQRNVFALLYKLAPDWNDSSDLAQEAFIRIWKGIGKLQNPRAFRSWMSQIVTNLFYDELRKRPRNTVVVSLDVPMNGEDEEGPTRDIADPAAGPAELYDRKDLRRSVDAAMATLPIQFRTAIMLREVDDLSYEEIARITKADIGTVKSRICRARTKVQNILRPQFRPEHVA